MKEIYLPLIILGLFYTIGLAVRPFDLDETSTDILATAVRIGLSIVLWRYVRARIRKDFFKNNWIVLPFLGILVLGTIYAKFGLGSEHSLSFFSSKHLIYTFFTASTGIFEELLFRATLFFAILKQVGNKQIWRAVIITSLLFAIAHLPNMFRPEGVNFSVFKQIAIALGVGLLLQSLLIRLRNLLLVVVLHALFNYWGKFSQMYEPVVSSENPTFSLSDVWGSTMNILIFVLFICLPVSYVILKGGSHKNMI